jgi:hypothetical protein
MKIKNIIALAFLVFLCISGIAQTVKSEVLLISTIHGGHTINPQYSYDSLFAFIDRYNPDLIGVEVREEDMDSSIFYLKSNYPYEMYHSITKYATKSVVGFDWLGADISGKPIPEDYWKEKSIIKKLQQKLSADTIMLKKLSVTDIIQEEKNKMALTSTLSELNDGRYDLINRVYYEQLDVLFKDTAYEPLAEFYKKRDEKIAQNISEIIKGNTGKKMIFLVGADHRAYTLKKISEEFESTILLNHISNY